MLFFPHVESNYNFCDIPFLFKFERNLPQLGKSWTYEDYFLANVLFITIWAGMDFPSFYT